jgi:uncharacterized MAPEG superfamily protein
MDSQPQGREGGAAAGYGRTPGSSASELLGDTFPLFAAVVLAAQLTGTHNALTMWGAQLYFWARVAYVPLYAAGVPLIRSLVWNVGTIGIMLLIVALFLGKQ